MIYVVQIKEISVIMESEGSILSVSRLDGRQVSIQLPGEKGGEEIFPACVHCHETLLVNSRWSISNAMGVSGIRGMYAVSLAFQRRM